MTEIVVGVDSGGSKTVAVVGDTKGNILGHGTAGAANPLSVGITRSVENIITAIKNAAYQIETPVIKSLFVGTAGGRPKALKDLTKALKLTPLLNIEGLIFVDHDLRTALYSGLPKGDGVVLIVGTGSAVFTVGKSGEDIIVSGWNHWLGETGGYELGVKAIIASTRSFDGRGPKTSLEKVVMEKFALKNFFEDVPVTFRAPFIDSPKIASLAPYVIEEALKGDREAKRIVDEMIDEMNVSIKAASKRAGIKNNLNIVLVGGIFRSKLDAVERLKKKISKWIKNFKFVFPKKEPAVAAYKLALKKLQESQKQMRMSFNSVVKN